MHACLLTALIAACRFCYCLRAAPALALLHRQPVPPASSAPRSQSCTPPTCRRRVADAPPTGPRSGAPAGPQRPLRRSGAASGTRRRSGTPTAREGVWEACAECAGLRRAAAAWSPGCSAAPSNGCPFRAGPKANARLRPVRRRGGSEAAPGGSGLAWGWCLVAPGPVRAARARLTLRSCRGRLHA